MVITSVLLATSVGLLLTLWWYRKRKFQIWSSRGVPGPKPSFIWGNAKEFSQKGFHKTVMDWHEKYGKTFGYYQGPTPFLVTSDLDMVKQILVKEFHKFHTRKPSPFVDPKDPNISMLQAHGENWKFLRSISSPSFSAKRMKEMSPLINKTVDSLMDLFGQKCEKDEDFDIYSDFQKLTLDTIASCAFGIEVDSLKNPNEVFLQQSRKVFDRVESVSGLLKFLSTTTTIFPVVTNLVVRPIFRLARFEANPWFRNTAREIIATRRNSQVIRDDFIQLMLNASVEDAAQSDVGHLCMKDDDVSNEISDAGENAAQGRRNSYREGKAAHLLRNRKTLTEQQMASQCILFLLAGYETTSTLLGFLSYELALHPEIQAKLQQEIDDHFPEKDPRPNYLTVQKLTYLDMVMKEALRLHTIGQVAISRECFEDCEICGIRIGKGDYIQIHANAIHMDPEQWGPEDPQEFVPERFLPERKQKRHPMAWIPFGDGPRNCIGMRFALMEAKIAVTRALKRYNITRSDKTQVPLQLSKNAVLRPSSGVWVKLESRN